MHLNQPEGLRSGPNEPHAALSGRAGAYQGIANMVCRLLRSKGAVLSVWGKAQLADLVEIASCLEAAVVESGGPVLSVSILPAGVPPADDDVRDQVMDLIPKLIRTCSAVHVVFEGEGFLSAIKRGVLTGLVHATRRHHLFFVHDHQASLLKALKGEGEAAAVARLLQTAREQGYFESSTLELEPSPRSRA